MNLDEALGRPGRMVAAWDHRWPQRAVLGVYATSERGAKPIHTEELAADQREATNDRVRERGVRLGGAYSYTGHVWVVDDRGLGVWTANATLVEGNAVVVALRGGGAKRGDGRKVIAFVDPEDVAHRGLRVELASGQQQLVVEERHPAAKDDPLYDDDKLREDMRWLVLLGQDLAMWVGVPFVDLDGDTTNANQLAIAEVSHAFAEGILALPATGAFEHATCSIGRFGGHGELQYRYAPNPLDLARRFLELRLLTASGKSSWARWVKQGTNPQVAAFLRDVRTPSAILLHMEEMARKLTQDGYA